jgi:hypothetical protein
MAKTRLSISLDEDQAERIRAYAERAGMDISNYLVSAAVHQMSILDQADAQFAHIDALAARAANEPETTIPVDDADLTAQELAEIQAARELLLGPQETEHADPRRHIA